MTTTAPNRSIKSTNGRSFSLGAVRAAAKVFAPVSPRLSTWALAELFCTPQTRPLRRSDRAALEAGTHLRIPHEDSELDAWSYGEGPTVLLVHGWAGRGVQLHAFVAPLLREGRRVVLFDAPAHGGSGGRTTNLGDFARAVASVIDALGEVKEIIAHSMGGASVAVALSRYVEGPERLVFVAPPIHPSTWIARFREMLDLSDEMTERLTAEIERRARVPLDEIHADRIAPTMKAALLVIHDRDDREVPYASGQRIASVWPGAELLTTEGLGHNRILSNPDVINSAVRFIARDAAVRFIARDAAVRFIARDAAVRFVAGEKETLS
jgi:pimeloyl-ACP methyl ester carboxylesterase